MLSAVLIKECCGKHWTIQVLSIMNSIISGNFCFKEGKHNIVQISFSHMYTSFIFMFYVTIRFLIHIPILIL